MIATQTKKAPEGNIFEKRESNVQTYARSFPRTFKRALGAEVWDVEGRRYIDFLAGAGSLNYGHNNPLMKEVLLDYIESDEITHSLDLHTSAKADFLKAMDEIILEPRGLDYVIQFTGPTGTNAVEAALKIARKVTGRSGIISFTNGFHGVSMGSLAITGNETLRHAAGVSLSGGMPMPFDGYFGDEVDTVAYIEKLLSDPSSGVDVPAAIILETVQGEGGLNTARIEWLKRLEALCKKMEILLIVDDIQAGCGRTGTFFSFEPAGIKPDIVTLSKSISGYGLPFSIVLIERSLDQWKPGEHNGTFRGNNLAFVTATAMLKHYWSDESFAFELNVKAEYLTHRLKAMVNRFSPNLCDVRGRGLMQGIRFADPAMAAAVAKKAFEHGLIIERCGPEDETIKTMMPITTSMELMDEGLDMLEAALEEQFGHKGLETSLPKAA